MQSIFTLIEFTYSSQIARISPKRMRQVTLVDTDLVGALGEESESK
ncbi:hypothetical protein ACFL2C_01435 [Patescibacteria group bacterium]